MVYRVCVAIVLFTDMPKLLKRVDSEMRQIRGPVMKEADT